MREGGVGGQGVPSNAQELTTNFTNDTNGWIAIMELGAFFFKFELFVSFVVQISQ